MLQDVEEQCLTLHRHANKKKPDPASQDAEQDPPTKTPTPTVDLPEGTQAMVSWLGESMAECVHWRRGALSYMLTATLASEKKTLDRTILQDGIQVSCACVGPSTSLAGHMTLRCACASED